LVEVDHKLQINGETPNANIQRLYGGAVGETRTRTAFATTPSR